MDKIVVYDIESLPNFFCICFAELDGSNKAVYEISDRKNERDDFITQFNDFILVAHNAQGYDNILFNYIIETPNCSAQEINSISQAIIGYGRSRSKTLKYMFSDYMHSRYFNSIDTMTLLASSKLRVSLKHLQVMTKWYNVKEFECDWDVNLPEDRFDECIEYCFNDVLSLRNVCLTLSKDFELRAYIKSETGLEVSSMDPVKIAELTMCNTIAEYLGESTSNFMWETGNMNRPTRSVKLGDLILPFITFKTPKFLSILDQYRDTDLDPVAEAEKSKNQKFNLPLMVNNMIFRFGLGGLHHTYSLNQKVNGSRKFVSTDSVKIIQSDVVSYYPTIRIKHLSHRFDPAFLNEYEKAYEEKAEGKRTGNKVLETFAKLKLNSVFGQYNNVHSPLYSPTVAYGTTINGQLMLGMFIETLLEAGFDVIGSNTDAVNVKVPVARWDEYLKIAKEWEDITSMTLEHDHFDSLYELSCNNYIAVMGDKVKTKGYFDPELKLLKGYKYPIVKNALMEYFINGTDIETFIRNHDDIYDFCMSTKMGKAKNGSQIIAYHNGVELQRINRFYASKSGCHMYKSSDGITMGHVLADSPVEIFNLYKKKSMAEYNINYDFYLKEARDIRDKIEPKQMNLF